MSTQPNDAAAQSSLAVPDSFRRSLDEALEIGRTDAKQFGDEHPDAADRFLVADWANFRLPFAPKDDIADLTYLHEVASTRSEPGNERARYWASHGLSDVWEGYLKEYVAGVGPEQARQATTLLHDVQMLTDRATQISKASNARQRPFVVDPTLELVVERPGNNPSYPSGHASAAFASSLVLAHLMPDRADELLDTAREASWSRVYAGVHFPSDVINGARLAGTIASHLIATSPAA